MIQHYSALKFFFIAIAFTACRQEAGLDEQKEQVSAPPLTLVEVVVASQGDLNREIKTTANLMANESTHLSAEVGGIINKINFKEGSEVKAGTLLLELNNSDIKADLQEAEVGLNLAEKQYLRSKKLKEAKGISEELLEEREAEMNAAKARFAKLSADLAKTKIYAPFDGKLGLRNHSPGDFLASGEAFTTLVNLDPLKLTFALPEKYLQAFSEGDTVWFKTSDNEMLRPAQIYAINPFVDQASRTFSLKAIFKNSDKTLKPGSFVSVYCQLEHYENAITLPTQAIVPEKESKFVFLVKNGKAVEQAIVAGIRIENQIQVLEGVKPGDTVVSSGLLQIRNGSLLKVRMDNNIVSKSSSGQ